MKSNHPIDHLPDSLHYVGIGGIGMSGLAQMSIALGRRVSGSDRAAESPENARIFHALKAQGIALYPQDGSVYEHCTPGAIVYSTAIEEDNADFSKAPAGIPRIHRSQALALSVSALSGRHTVAVTGTCGKTTVSAWVAEALENLGADPGFLGGGLVNAFVSEKEAGNFKAGKGRFFVLEADESDKSLLNYHPDSVVVMNIGTDHYSKEELARVFREFILESGQGVAVIEEDAFLKMGPEAFADRNVVVFSSRLDAPSETAGRKVRKLDHYEVRDGKVFCSFDGMPEIRLPYPGIHNAVNALAVYTLLLELGYAAGDSLKAVENFHGVWRRFDYAGSIPGSGVPVYDDYAHNVEKILSCLSGARSLCGGRLFAVFQPHGFGPLKFMREELFHALEGFLREEDRFIMMPVYYAGGTAAFTPTSSEVIADYCKKSVSRRDCYKYCEKRSDAEQLIYSQAEAGDLVVVMGARDHSLSTWAEHIAEGGRI